MELTLLSRPGCHLCDDMLHALSELQGRCGFSVAVVDVDRDPELARDYGNDIPVLLHAGTELCRHRLDSASLTDYLAKTG